MSYHVITPMIWEEGAAVRTIVTAVLRVPCSLFSCSSAHALLRQPGLLRVADIVVLIFICFLSLSRPKKLKKGRKAMCES